MDWTGVVIVVLAGAVVVSLVVQWRGRRSELPMPSVPPALEADAVGVISDLVARGRRVEAIRALREATGLGLRESKEWVDAWEPGSTAPLPTSARSAHGPSPAVLDELAAQTRALRQSAGLVEAVRHVRSRTGWGLAESKAYVDRVSAR